MSFTSLTGHSLVHSSFHFIHSSMHLSLQPSIHSCTKTTFISHLIHATMHRSIRSFIHSCTHSFNHSSIHFIHSVNLFDPMQMLLHGPHEVTSLPPPSGEVLRFLRALPISLNALSSALTYGLSSAFLPPSLNAFESMT